MSKAAGFHFHCSFTFWTPRVIQGPAWALGRPVSCSYSSPTSTQRSSSSLPLCPAQTSCRWKAPGQLLSLSSLPHLLIANIDSPSPQGLTWMRREAAKKRPEGSYLKGTVHAPSGLSGAGRCSKFIFPFMGFSVAPLRMERSSPAILLAQCLWHVCSSSGPLRWDLP